MEGFSFKDDYATKCSYLHVLDTLCKLTEHGTEDFSLKAFTTKKFILPFKLSPSINSLDAVTNESVQQNSINPVSNQRKLYLKFKTNTTYAIRVSCIYVQHRSICIDKNLRVFKDFDLDQWTEKRVILFGFLIKISCIKAIYLPIMIFFHSLSPLLFCV